MKRKPRAMRPGFFHGAQHQRSCKPSMLVMVAARNNSANIPPTIPNKSIGHPWCEFVVRIKPGGRFSFPPRWLAL
jgi:NAD(P)H-flavin reductase